MSEAERARRNAIWKGKQALESKGIAEDKAIFSRGCFFITQEDNTVLEVGKLVDDAPKWNGAAPEGIAEA